MDIKKQPKKRIHIILFVITVITTTFAGAEWMYGRTFVFSSYPLGWDEFMAGLRFSIPFLAILTIHEFGHYLTARKHKVKVSLPYYIPLWLGFIGMPFTIGTLGAFIRIRERINDKKKNFDIGVAGPIAGFVAALIILVYGFANLPPKTYVYEIHPEYEVLGKDFDKILFAKDTFVLKRDVEKFNPDYAASMPDTAFFYRDMPSISMGSTLLFSFLEATIVPDSKKDRIPSQYEAFHYPLLFAGFLALFFTALNMLPIGQLDGGHVIYGMFGSKNHAIISRIFFVALVFYSGLGLISPYDTQGSGNGFFSSTVFSVLLYVLFLFYILRGFGKDPWTRLTWAVGIFAVQYLVAQFFPGIKGYPGWLLFAFMIGRLLGVDYPPALNEAPLDTNRIILGWFALLVLILSFSPAPLMVTGI